MALELRRAEEEWKHRVESQLNADARRRARRFARGGPLSYLISAALAVVALAIRFQIDDLLPSGFPFLTFFPAVIVTAFLCGAGPGLVSAAIGFVASWYFFVPPLNSFALSAPAIAALAFYLLIVGVYLAIIDRLITATEQLARERTAAIRAADEKKTLFSEAQHRIGNNLQAISSMLQIQARTVSDPHARRALGDAVQRVGLIAEIQRLFHNPDQNDGVIDDDYVRKLVDNCVRAIGLEGTIDVNAAIAPISLPQDAFLAVSLVMTECVNNALEHAKPNGGSGRIVLAIAMDPPSENGLVVLTIRDNGVGLPDDFDAAAPRSIGMKVIQSFARQLDGAFEMANAPGGAVCRLAFPLRRRDP